MYLWRNNLDIISCPGEMRTGKVASAALSTDCVPPWAEKGKYTINLSRYMPVNRPRDRDTDTGEKTRNSHAHSHLEQRFSVTSPIGVRPAQVSVRRYLSQFKTKIQTEADVKVYMSRKVTLKISRQIQWDDKISKEQRASIYAKNLQKGISSEEMSRINKLFGSTMSPGDMEETYNTYRTNKIQYEQDGRIG